MESGRSWRSGVALAVLVLVGMDVRAALGQAAASGAAAVGPAPAIRTADLAALGPAGRWRTLIAGDTRKLPKHERLIVTGSDGRILLQADGDERGVAIPPQWMPVLRERGAGLILAHNHPDGQSLSIDDLAQFEKRGLAVVVALGHDGSLYAAAEGPRYRDASFVAVYMAASREVERQVRLHKVEASAFVVHRNHLVALALARAGVIVYRSDLAYDRWHAYNSYAALCGDIVRAAEATVRQLLGP